MAISTIRRRAARGLDATATGEVEGNDADIVSYGKNRHREYQPTTFTDKRGNLLWEHERVDQMSEFEAALTPLVQGDFVGFDRTGTRYGRLSPEEYIYVDCPVVTCNHTNDNVTIQFFDSAGDPVQHPALGLSLNFSVGKFSGNPITVAWSGIAQAYFENVPGLGAYLLGAVGVPLRTLVESSGGMAGTVTISTIQFTDIGNSAHIVVPGALILGPGAPEVTGGRTVGKNTFGLT